MSKILVVEDNLEEGKRIQDSLMARHYVVTLVHFGQKAWNYIQNNAQFDVILLDINLTDISGLELIKYIRHGSTPCKNKPIIVTSGMDHETQLCALSLGADEYIPKPIDPRELSIRINAVCRRTMGHAHNVINCNGLQLDLSTNVITINGKILDLSGQGFLLLRLLIMKKGTILTKQTIINWLYNDTKSKYPELKIVDVLICKLRKVLKKYSDVEYIHTSCGTGYLIPDTYHNSTHAANPIEHFIADQSYYHSLF